MAGPFYIGNGSFEIYWYCTLYNLYSEALYSSWRGRARLLLQQCLRRNAGNSSGPPEEFWGTDLIASMMSSLVILLSDKCILPVGVQRIIWILANFSWVGSAEELVVHSFFFCLFPDSPFHPKEVRFPFDGSVSFYKFVVVFLVMLDKQQ